MVIFIVKLFILIILLVFSFNSMSVDNIDYEDIYDNIDDYEYPYNHINREGV